MTIRWGGGGLPRAEWPREQWSRCKKTPAERHDRACTSGSESGRGSARYL